ACVHERSQRTPRNGESPSFFLPHWHYLNPLATRHLSPIIFPWVPDSSSRFCRPQRRSQGRHRCYQPRPISASFSLTLGRFQMTRLPWEVPTASSSALGLHATDQTTLKCSRWPCRAAASSCSGLGRPLQFMGIPLSLLGRIATRFVTPRKNFWHFFTSADCG